MNMNTGTITITITIAGGIITTITTIIIAGIIITTTTTIITITTTGTRIERRTAQLREPGAVGDYRQIDKRADDGFYRRRLVLD
jgi:hypothetical protein